VTGFPSTSVMDNPRARFPGGCDAVICDIGHDYTPRVDEMHRRNKAARKMSEMGLQVQRYYEDIGAVSIWAMRGLR